MRQLKFPPYEYIKSLPTDDEVFVQDYHWTLFSTPVSVSGVLTYNEDDSRYLFFDVWEDGYVEKNRFGLSLKLNKANYSKICKHAQRVYEEFCRELDKDYSWQWDKENNNDFTNI